MASGVKGTPKDSKGYVDSNSNTDLTPHKEDKGGHTGHVQDSLLRDMFTSVTKLHDKFDMAMTNIRGLQDEINKPETGIIDKVNSTISQTEDNSAEITEMKKDIADMKEQIQLLVSIVDKKDKQICTLNSEVSDLKGRSMRDNLVFSGVEEEAGEDLEEKIGILLESIGVDLEYGNSGPVSFDRLHRFGTRNGIIPRPIVGKIHDYKDKVTILTMAPELKNRNVDEKVKIFISDQFTDEVREKRTEAFAKFKANDKRPKEEKLKMRLAHDKLFINGELDRPAVTRPSVLEVMTEDTDEGQ